MTLIVLNPSNVIARSLAMEAARRQALKNLGYDENPVIKHQMEVQRRRSELLQQYHPEVYDAEQDYARQLLRRDEVNLTPQSSDNYLNSGNKYKKAEEQGDLNAKDSLSEMTAQGECENAGTPVHILGIKGTVTHDNHCK